MKLEICVDNHESLITAVKNGADRIELCASLKEGGLTPPCSFIEESLKLKVPVFIMIRPRSCDFLYSGDEIEMMLRDIHSVKKMGAPGVVFGALNEKGEIDFNAMKSLVKESSGMDVTCHRAIDQVNDVLCAIEALTELGVKRILTSGQEENPQDGIENLRKMVRHAKKKIKIMAAGVYPHNVREIIEETEVDEVHSAAAKERKTLMKYIKSEARMGKGEDFSLTVTDGKKVNELKTIISDYL